MNNERFSIPELLFNPMDVGFTEMGVGEALVDVCNRFPSGNFFSLIIEAFKLSYQLFVILANACNLYSNILLTGGSCEFPGFAKRL